MFENDPENRPKVSPSLNETQKRNLTRSRMDDSLQKVLDSQKKIVLSRPSDIKVTNRSFWKDADRSGVNKIHTKNEDLSRNKNVYTVKPKKDPHKTYAKAGYDRDVNYDESQIETYYSGLVKDQRGPKKYKGMMSFHYMTIALTGAVILVAAYYAYKAFKRS